MNKIKKVMVILSVVLGIAAVITLVMSLSKDRATDKSKEIIARINNDTAVVNNQENDSDRKSTRLNSSHKVQSRMPSSA